MASADATSALFPIPAEGDEPAADAGAFAWSREEPGFDPPLAVPAVGTDDPFGALAGVIPFAFDDGGAESDRGTEPIDFSDVEPSDFGRAAFAAVPGFDIDSDQNSGPIGVAADEPSPPVLPRDAAEAWEDAADPFVVAGVPGRTAETTEPADEAELVAADAWPSFVASARDDAVGLSAVGDLFARLRAQKAALVEEGALVVAGTLRRALPAPVSGAPDQAVGGEPERLPVAFPLRNEGPLVANVAGNGSNPQPRKRSNGVNLVARPAQSSGFDLAALREQVRGEGKRHTRSPR
ncbi:MAG: hypothetical protein AVDCRST_MAG73-3175 [uncultured Thermomicrobiales bacterium]|uniref:Uncharacterized protein n=1 Tax=uncultured Thermomicrobiales bacterium TaxID=1645740 RepID=A0A6J4ULZ4_9BACT|nr:MAG: hypothetical protein AVDCRST_MAG73-3175 [uncultured Thermomicrobiales bacterium]